MKSEAKALLRQLLLRSKGQGRLGLAWTALFLGSLLLLLSISLWWNFRQVLEGRGSADPLGSSFLTVSKSVTDATMGRTDQTRFTSAELEGLRRAPQVQDVGPLTPASFPVQASLGGGLGFSTLLFLESAPDRFLDQKPETWTWRQGEVTLPIILSKDFLNTYNYVFAPTQGLPQLSENAVRAIGFNITIGQGTASESYRAQVTGFSDRIASVLVPESFLLYANRQFGTGSIAPARVLVRVEDPSSTSFVNYLSSHHYTTNAESLRWNRLRRIVTGVSTGTGVLALLLLVAGIGIFILFLELTLARSRDAVRLLLELGYSPAALRSFLLRRFVPLALTAVLAGLVLAAVAQAIASSRLQSSGLTLSTFPGPLIWGAALLTIILIVLQLRFSVGRSLKSTSQ
jgi:hypothetical protein